MRGYERANRADELPKIPTQNTGPVLALVGVLLIIAAVLGAFITELSLP